MLLGKHVPGLNIQLPRSFYVDPTAVGSAYLKGIIEQHGGQVHPIAESDCIQIHIDGQTPYTECYYSRKVLKFSSLLKVFSGQTDLDSLLQDPDNYVPEEDFERLDASSPQEFRAF